MAIGIAGRLVRLSDKTPITGTPVEIVQASGQGAVGGSVIDVINTDAQGVFTRIGLADAVYFAVPRLAGSDWNIQLSVDTLYQPNIANLTDMQHTHAAAASGGTIAPGDIIHTHASDAQGGNTLTTPTIASLANATHTHADAAGGGNTLTAPTIADLTNATHAHTAAASGGATLTSPTIVTPTIAATDWTNATHAHALANSGGSALTPVSVVASGDIDAAGGFRTVAIHDKAINATPANATIGVKRVRMYRAGSVVAITAHEEDGTAIAVATSCTFHCRVNAAGSAINTIVAASTAGNQTVQAKDAAGAFVAGDLLDIYYEKTGAPTGLFNVSVWVEL